jgi:hypothetical protein
MTFESTVIAVVQLVFGLVLLPTLRNKNASVPRQTSVPMALGLFVIAAMYVRLGLWLAVGMASVCGVMWIFVVLFRPVRKNMFDIPPSPLAQRDRVLREPSMPSPWPEHVEKSTEFSATVTLESEEHGCVMCPKCGRCCDLPPRASCAASHLALREASRSRLMTRDSP